MNDFPTTDRQSSSIVTKSSSEFKLLSLHSHQKENSTKKSKLSLQFHLPHNSLSQPKQLCIALGLSSIFSSTTRCNRCILIQGLMGCKEWTWMWNAVPYTGRAGLPINRSEVERFAQQLSPYDLFMWQKQKQNNQNQNQNQNIRAHGGCRKALSM